MRAVLVRNENHPDGNLIELANETMAYRSSLLALVRFASSHPMALKHEIGKPKPEKFLYD